MSTPSHQASSPAERASIFMSIEEQVLSDFQHLLPEEATGERSPGSPARCINRQHRRAVTCSNNADALRAGATAAHTQESQHGPIFKPAAETRLKDKLEIAGHGSALRGWRWLLDPDGTLEVPWNDLDQACKTMGFVKSEEELLDYLQSSPAISVELAQVLSELGVVVEMFRRWMTEMYGGQNAFFNVLDVDSTGTITQDHFVKTVRTEGFTVTEHELQELFCFCDIIHKNYITRDLTIFLETDPVIRERELLKLKLNQKYEQDRILVSCYKEDNLPMGHRLAIRPWMKHKYEALPTIARQRVVAREGVLRQNGLQARTRFIKQLRSFHATEMRAWRRGIDPEGKFTVTRSAFKQFCRKIQFEDDINALWTSFDPYAEGVLQVEQFSLQAADVLASLRTWAHRSFGSLAGLFQTPEAIARRQKRRKDGTSFVTASMSVGSFASLLWSYGYPPLFGPDGDVVSWYIGTTLDFHGGSLIECSDLAWLDGWTPTEWLVTDPDIEAWNKIRDFLKGQFGSLLRAWRRELDTENRNRLTWKEWCKACQRLGIEGNIAGAWRALDDRRCGSISLNHVCEESANLLGSFKSWAEIKFSSMPEAFRAMDADGGGSLSLAELKSACYKYKCVCDAQALFHVLSTNGRNISRKDYHFLSDWPSVDEEAAAEFKSVTEDLWKDIVLGFRSRAASRGVQPESVNASKIFRPQVVLRGLSPSRVGSAQFASTSGCIPADFVLGTKFPVSPYAMSQQPRGFSAGKPNQKTRLRRIGSAPSITQK